MFEVNKLSRVVWAWLARTANMSARSSNQAGTADECDLSPRTPKWYSINSSAVSMVYGKL